MKTAAKIIFYILSFFLLLLAFLHFALIYILPLEDVKNKIVSAVEKNLNAEVKINKISASLFDFSLSGIDLLLKDSSLLHIGSAQIYFSPLHLLKGQIKVIGVNLDAVEINIVKDEQGRFNFEQLVKESGPAAEKLPKTDQKDENGIIDVLFCKTHIQNGIINYTDQKNKLTLNVTQISFYIEQFSFDEIFKLNASLEADAVLNGRRFDSLYLALNSFIHLHSMNLTKATANIDNFIIKFKETVIACKGNIENFTAPVSNINIKIKNISNNAFKDFADISEFLIPEIDITSRIKTNIDKNTVTAEELTVQTLGSLINIRGNLDYSGKDLTYNFDLSFDFLLETIGPAFKMISAYAPNGNLKGNFLITDKNLMQGGCKLVNAGFFMPNLGYFTDINSDISIKNIDNIKIPKLTGNLNNNPFLLEASYMIGKNSGDISMLFRAKKILGITSKELDNAEKNTAQKDKNSQKIKNETKKSNLPPLNVKVDFMADDIDTRFFKGKDILFKMNLSDVTPTLDIVKGDMNFQSGQGTIKDLYKLTNSNALMKGLFLSLDIVSRVINALNVLDILNSIGSAIFTSNSENATENQPEQKQKLDGKMDFDSFISFLNLADGKATFEKCSFVSGLLSFKVDGEMNFKKNKLDMTVNAAPGRHEDDGIMPLTMKITGTTEEPSGSLSLLGSVSSIVSQSLLNNAVSDGLKKGFMSLLGLKKHDEKGNEIQDVNISTNTFANTQQSDTQK